VQKALALDPDLAEAQATLGWIRTGHDWDWSGADAAYARALELEPGNAMVLRRAATLAATLGRLDEALERAYARRDSGLSDLKGNPLLASLESDPRYPAFLARMRLPL
jgi:tetratricopeptide (TPR) repeat protein